MKEAFWWRRTLSEIEREAIIRLLEENNGNRSATATILRLSKGTIKNKVREYEASGLTVPPPTRGITKREM